VVYTLTLSVYCTAWTFYGAVGFAARSGLDYLTIYLGPTLVFLAWWWLLRKLVRIGRSQRLTSIADLVSSRFGKSDLLAVLVTVLAVIGTTPYIALQLQSITLSFAAFAHTGPEAGGRPGTAIWVAAGLAVFTILFGTRSLDANHRHHGVMIAIALEAVVKLAALVAVGVFVVWGLSGGLGPALDAIDAAGIAAPSGGGGRWLALIFLAAAAVLTLPRMFQVTVVENADERHLATAAWAFPLYLLGISLFVLPIAAAGLALLPQGSNPDLFVLTLPLAADRDGLALFAFLGGFSSATSMIVVAALALSIMVSNHIVVPLWLRFRRDPATVAGDLRHRCPARPAQRHRRRPDAGLWLLRLYRRHGRAGLDRVDQLCRRRPDPARAAGRGLLARRDAGRCDCRAGRGFRAVGLYPVPAQLRRQPADARRGDRRRPVRDRLAARAEPAGHRRRPAGACAGVEPGRQRAAVCRGFARHPAGRP
jgi:hypothetical protein